MCGATVDGPFGFFTDEKTIDQAGSEGVTAANAIENLDIFPVRRLEKLPIVVTDGTPVVARGGFGFAQRGGHDLEGKLLYDRLNHLFESIDLERGHMLIHAWHFKPKSGRKIFFVAKHDIDIGR